MKVTCIVKNTDLNDYFAASNSVTDKDKLQKILKSFNTGCKYIQPKIGTGRFADRVELNQIMRKEDYSVKLSISARRGYDLMTFEIN